MLPPFFWPRSEDEYDTNRTSERGRREDENPSEICARCQGKRPFQSGVRRPALKAEGIPRSPKESNPTTSKESNPTTSCERAS